MDAMFIHCEGEPGDCAVAERWWTDALVDQLLAEDVPSGDLTTTLLGISQAPGGMRFSMRADAVVCGIELAADLITRAGAEARCHVASGDRVEAGAHLLSAQGPAGALHKAWKVSQTLVEYLSGIATATAAIVEAARAVDPHAAVVTTRKTLPGSKAMMLAAIRAGGAQAHRLGLSETLLVFPEHRVFLDDPMTALSALRRAAPEKKGVVEVADLETAGLVLEAAPDILQCEKMTPEGLAEVVAEVKRRGLHTLVAAAGGVNATNAAAYVRAGAALLVTSAPYWAKPADVKVVIEAL